METMRLDLVGVEEKAPHVAVAARERGVTGVLSTPALRGDETIATLNLYSRSGALDQTAEAVAAVLATRSRSLSAGHRNSLLLANVVEQAQREADDQADIHLATGMPMANHACIAEQAPGLLRQAAPDGEQTILGIAQRIIRQHRSTL